MRLLPFLLPLLAACAPAQRFDRSAFGCIVAVQVLVDAGNVTVAGDGAIVEVARSLYGAAVHAVTEQVVDGVLRIEARCASVLPCGADIALRVPRGLPVEVRTGEGNVRVAGLGGALTIEVGDGDVSAVGLGGGAVRVQAGLGDAWIGFAAAPREVRVGVGVGDVVLAVPAGGYALDVASAEAPRIAVAQDDTGPRVQVRTASGQATVAPG